MKKQNRLILWAVVILLCCGIVLWVGRKSTRVHERPLGVASKSPSIAPTPAPNQNAVVPIAATNQGVVTTNAAASSPRKFVDIGILEQEAIMSEIRKQDLASIFRMWIEARHVDDDLMKQASLGSALAYVMRERMPSPDLLEQIRAFIADSSNSINERAQLLAALGRAATKESMDVLIQAATTLSDKQMRQAAFEQIRSAGAYAQRGDGAFHEELSPALEQVWRESQDQGLLPSIAVAMAKVGAPSGIELLLSSALDGSPNDLRTQVAQRSLLQEVLNPHAVPTLSALLVNQPPTSAASRLASGALANMVDAASAKALLNWLQSADAGAAPLAYDYVVRTRAPAQLAAWESALDPIMPFRSEKNREAIRAGLAEYHQDHR